MLNSSYGVNGGVVAPHALAADAGMRVLREGGNAVEAAIAAAATIAVVYPHMNSIGGDGFWVIDQPGQKPIGIHACGRAAQRVDIDFFRDLSFTKVPSRGGTAAITTAGTIAGWQKAQVVAEHNGGELPLARLLEDAIHYARHGFAVTRSQFRKTIDKLDELRTISGFAEHFLIDGKPISEGRLQKQPALAETLSQLAAVGLDDFYRGDVARAIHEDLQAAGSPIVLQDLAGFGAEITKPLSIQLSCGRIYNLGAPTQGFASLMILALFDKLGLESPSDDAHIHSLVEITKAVFQIRDTVLGDPEKVATPLEHYLTRDQIDSLAAEIDFANAQNWSANEDAGDTVWIGAVDKNGVMVSFIQSTYWEYGSGVVLPQTGITWQNRGASFSLDPMSANAVGPGRQPMHTLNPAMACLNDGRKIVYGSMGGDGQPQNQAAMFTRYVYFGLGLQESITLPRWLSGRTWGDVNQKLHLEGRYSRDVIAALKDVGHDVNVVEEFSEMMGHAGALVRHPSGVVEGAFDVRSDGRVSYY